jgi:hypothetical protein|tara:strand:- start:3862 stop:4074 length:213 start_codon:yes stop_codon:yes gene_type:complete
MAIPAAAPLPTPADVLFDALDTAGVEEVGELIDAVEFGKGGLGNIVPPVGKAVFENKDDVDGIASLYSQI